MRAGRGRHKRLGGSQARHRRPSARPAAIVTLGAGALLLAAAVPAGSVVDPSAAPAAAQHSAETPAEGLEFLDQLVEKLSSEDPSALADALKEGLGKLQDGADAKSLAAEGVGRVKHLAEQKAAALDVLVEETVRQIGGGAQEKLKTLAERVKSLRDELRGAGGESMSAQSVYDSLIGILKDVAGG
jgi:hypothetical protein